MGKYSDSDVSQPGLNYLLTLKTNPVVNGELYHTVMSHANTEFFHGGSGHIF